jgi:hypothetical protein
MLYATVCECVNMILGKVMVVKEVFFFFFDFPIQILETSDKNFFDI